MEINWSNMVEFYLYAKYTTIFKIYLQRIKTWSGSSKLRMDQWNRNDGISRIAYKGLHLLSARLNSQKKVHKLFAHQTYELSDAQSSVSSSMLERCYLHLSTVNCARASICRPYCQDVRHELLFKLIGCGYKWIVSPM